MPITTATIGTSVSNAYVSTGNTAVTYLTLTNITAGNVIANVYVVPSGNAAGNSNVTLLQIEIATLDTYQLYQGGEKLLLNNGDSIQANSNGSSSITTVCSYTTI
jgi:hypothetical protein